MMFDHNLDVCGDTIDELVANGLYAKAIQWLTHYINVEYKTSTVAAIGGQSAPNGYDPRSAAIDNLYRYLLLRSYCYYKIRVDNHSMALAIDDVMEAIGVDDQRFQSYMLGSLILSESNRYEESLEMLEKCLRVNPCLNDLLSDKLVYLKFKILTVGKRCDEETALKNATRYRYLDECVQHIHTNDLNAGNDFNVLRFIDGKHSNNGYVKNIQTNYYDTVATGDSRRQQPYVPAMDSFGAESVFNNENNNNYSSPTAGNQFVDYWFNTLSIATDNNAGHNNYDNGGHTFLRPIGSARAMGGGDHSSGETYKASNHSPYGSSRMVSESLKSAPIGAEDLLSADNNTNDDTVSEDRTSLDIEFRDLLATTTKNGGQKKSSPAGAEGPWIDVKSGSKWRSVQRWVDGTASQADTAAKLCKIAAESQAATAAAATTRRPSLPAALASFRPNSACSIDSGRQSGMTTPVRSSRGDCKPTDGPVTNILKLRGVYVGNLRPNCAQKPLLDVCKQYGTVLDYYQPSGECYAFVHFKTAESATHLVVEWNGRPLDEQCMAGRSLIIRFTPSQEQMSKYNSMSYGEYKRRCNERPYAECDRWRSGKRCPYDRQCPYGHVRANRAIDTLPDKRKSKWRVE